MKKFEDLKKELLRDAATRREYQKLESEYKLAQELLKARLQKRLTQSELAEKAGVKQEYVARLESGMANPTVANVNKIAGALGKHLKLVGS
jgi:ribosome-binding protein aMBF1 (putative translation factor)